MRKNLTNWQWNTVRHGWLVIPHITFVVLMNLWNPHCGACNYNDPRIEYYNITKNKNQDKNYTNTNINNNEFPSDHNCIILSLLILTFINFLQQPKSKKKTCKKVSASRYSDKIETYALWCINKMLPKESEIPDDANA